MHDLEREASLHVTWWRGAVGPLLPGAPRAGTALPTSPRPCGDTGAAADPARALARLAEGIAACTRCRLAATRTTTVPGEGAHRPRLVVVGEAPGAEEDRTGRPFVGRAGELLTRMLAAIGCSREAEVFVLNVLKCRPPENRPPRPDEAAACRPWLTAQLEALGPPLLLALGSHAARLLLGTERGITALRGRFHTTPEGWRVMPTYHPAYLLRTPAAKREAWEDLKQVAGALGAPPDAPGGTRPVS
jgi:DNA polymerase